MRSLRLFRLQSQTRVLDVGCGAGLIIYDLAELGYQGMLGIDPFIERDLHYSNGARVRKVGIEDVTGKWDLLMFHHSFEHMPDPAATLRRVHDLLEVGGHCLLRVPTVSSFAWQHYGTEWVQLDAPRHLYLFSRPSIERLAAANGFELVNVTYDSDAFQFWGSEQYRRGIPLKSELSYAVNPTAATFTAKQMLDFSRRAKKLNRAGQGDQAAFYLRKLSP
jgi:SAM-dependent methyltransferase